jgi:hypothetical protein
MHINRDIRIRVTPLQYEIIKNKAALSGEKTVSSYIRRALTKTDDFSVEKLIQEIHAMIVQEKRLKTDGGAKNGYNPRNPSIAETQTARKAPEREPGTSPDPE